MRWTPTHTIASAAIIAVSVAVACSNQPGVQPSVPPVEISCPAPPQVNSPDGKSVTVAYTAPIASGGQAPLTTTCTPVSGATFNVGSTLVRCSARDVARRSAECAFNVTVAQVPTLAVTKFLAFGDSMTAGVNPTDCGLSVGNRLCSIRTLTSTNNPDGIEISVADELRALYPRLGEETPSAYPRQLRNALAARYSSQTLTMNNQGSPGEMIAGGLARFPGTMAANAPEVVLLFEGANDANQAPLLRTPSALVNDLRSMVRDARGRGMTVFLATLIPQRPLTCRGQDFCDNVYDTPLINTQIRAMAAAEGAVLVDLFPLFDGKVDTLLGMDGLHPNDAGYKVIAEAFATAIQARFEN